MAQVSEQSAVWYGVWECTGLWSPVQLQTGADSLSDTGP